MAKVLVCDHPYRSGVCGMRVDAPVTVVLDGKTHELEICAHHASPIRELVAAVPQQRRAKPTPARRSRPKQATDAEVRAWAQANGKSVNTKGRVSRTLKDEYLASQQ